MGMVRDRARGDRTEASFEEFVQGRSAAFARLAYLLTGDRHDAEDLVQTAFARIAARWHRVGDPEAYARRVLYTQAVSWLRVVRRRRGEVLTGAPPETGRTGPGDPDLRIVLAQALAKLSPKQRAVLVLRFYEDRSEVETAELLSVHVGTVKSQTRLALRKLREQLPELADLMAQRTAERTTEEVTAG
jgi:RNA polymerase sigma-70 factor (sigma-E family)